jgi:spermidine synthase
VIKHPIDSVTLVELDPKVIEISQQYLPGISGGAFADPRLSVVLGDGARYIAEAGRRFDVIIVDSTDPIGPAQALFTDPFYAACRMALRETGVISLQSGCPFYQTAHVTRALSRLRDRFGAAGAYLAPVPTYANGLLALMIAGLEDHLIPALEVLRSRVEMIGLDTEYYSPVVHHAAFAMPPRFARNYDDDQSEERFARPLPDWIGRPIRRRTLASRTSR